MTAQRAARAARTALAVQRFVDTDVDRLLDDRAATDPMPAMLALFQRTAAGVPAYAAFRPGQRDPTVDHGPPLG